MSNIPLVKHLDYAVSYICIGIAAMSNMPLAKRTLLATFRFRSDMLLSNLTLSKRYVTCNICDLSLMDFNPRVCFVREPLISLFYFTVTVDVVYTRVSDDFILSVRSCVCVYTWFSKSIIVRACVCPHVCTTKSGFTVTVDVFYTRV